jgi:hypothetical protein
MTDATFDPAHELAILEDLVAREPTPLPGVVNFPPNGPEGLTSLLPDGVHRLEGSAWQFTVSGGRVLKAVRSDMRHYLGADETVHPVEPPAAPAEPPAAPGGAPAPTPVEPAAEAAPVPAVEPPPAPEAAPAPRPPLPRPLSRPLPSPLAGVARSPSQPPAPEAEAAHRAGAPLPDPAGLRASLSAPASNGPKS